MTKTRAEGRAGESTSESKVTGMSTKLMLCVCVLWIEESATWHLQEECECELAQATRGNTIHIFYLCLYACVCVNVCAQCARKRMRVFNMTHGMHSENVTSSKVGRENRKKNTHTRDETKNDCRNAVENCI